MVLKTRAKNEFLSITDESNQHWDFSSEPVRSRSCSFNSDEILRLYAQSRLDNGAKPDLDEISEFGKIPVKNRAKLRVVCVTLSMCSKLFDCGLRSGKCASFFLIKFWTQSLQVTCYLSINNYYASSD